MLIVEKVACTMNYHVGIAHHRIIAGATSPTMKFDSQARYIIFYLYNNIMFTEGGVWGGVWVPKYYGHLLT